MTESVVALRKTLPDGRSAVVSVLAGGSTVVHVDGQEYGSHCGPHHAFYRQPGTPDEYVAAIGRVLLTAQEAEQIETVWAQVRSEAPRNLRSERAALVDQVAAAEHTWSAQHNQRLDEGDWADPFGTDEANEAAIAAARTELAEFDRRHPELVADLASERRAALLRRMWD
ncbi:hypothetical protein [Nocardia sp. NPDC003963]